MPTMPDNNNHCSNLHARIAGSVASVVEMDNLATAKAHVLATAIIDNALLMVAIATAMEDCNHLLPAPTTT